MAEWAMHHAQVGGAIHIGQNIATDRILKNAPVYHIRKALSVGEDVQ